LIYNYQLKIFQFFIQKKIEGKYLCKIKGIIKMSDSSDINTTTNENMIPQGPPLVNPQNTNAQANNIIEHHMHTPPASPASIHPPRLERRNNNRAPVLMRSDSVRPLMLERNESVCHERMLDPSDFGYDSVLESNPNFELFDPSIYRYIGYGSVLERSDSVRPLMLERTDTLCPPPLERNEPACLDRMLDPTDFGYDSVLESATRDPNWHAMFDPSNFMHDGYGPVLERSDSIRHLVQQPFDSIHPSILTRSDFISPPPLIRNDSRVPNNDDGPPPLIRLGSDIFPVVYDFTSDDEYDIVQRDTFEWFPKEMSSQPP
jgi:hypothetical protein